MISFPGGEGQGADMAAPVFETCHVACCANRTPHVLSWSRRGLIAFGSCSSVALYDPQEVKITALLNKHTGRVNAVQWVHREDCGPETHLVSGGSDNSVIVWKEHDGKFAASAVCSGHSGPVCAVDAVPLLSGQLLLASASSDSTVKLWTFSDGAAECLQTISFGSGFMMDVSLALLPGSEVPILACGGDDSKVILYVQLNGQFQKVLTLQGHEDWIRSVEWAAKDGELLLASCSQDCMIRVWKLVVKCAPQADASAEEGAIRMKEDVFEVKGNVYAVTLETVLAGHENWVYGIHWQPPVNKGSSVEQPLSLLSASMDKTMILWGPEEASGVWVEKVRVGEVGGNTLGFLGCQMSPDGSKILAHAFHGALHLWYRDQGDQEGEWSPGVVVSGHFSAVQDLSWDPEGEFLLSVGSDQTSRLFTPWRRKDCTQVTWHEISRPQIHGYDMQCLATVGRFQFVSGADEKVLRVFRAPRNFVENFANIAGTSLEKLLASTDAASLPEGASTPALGLSNKAVFQGDLATHNTQEKEGDFNSASAQYKESYFHPLSLTEPPPEDHLLQNTLWPEVQKLYGHGFEMFCLASDSARTVVASACKICDWEHILHVSHHQSLLGNHQQGVGGGPSGLELTSAPLGSIPAQKHVHASKAEHASILLWSTSSWKQLQALPCHSLTVTQMAFSPDGRLLLAVSRDRTWSLWKRENTDGSEPRFSLYTHSTKDSAVHTRIIWSCDWSPDNKYFVTSSRDKKVIMWGHRGSVECVGENSSADVRPCSSVLDVGDSATAVTVCPFLLSDQSYLLAVGLESGQIVLYKWKPVEDLTSGSDWSKCAETDATQSHTLVVKRLRWRPRSGQAGQQDEDKRPSESGHHAWVQLASAGADHAVKIFNINTLTL